MDYLEFIARVISHIPDRGQVTVRYYGLYGNAHRGKVRKVSFSPFVLRKAEEGLKPIPSKGWAAMIQKVYEVDLMICRKCGSSMKVIAFITDYQPVDRIINYLKLRFVAEKPPNPPSLFPLRLQDGQIRFHFYASCRKDSLVVQVLVDQSISQDPRVALLVCIIVCGFGIDAILPRFDDSWREGNLANNEMTAGVINLKMLIDLGDNKTPLETEGTVDDEGRHSFFRYYPKKLGRPGE